MCPRGCDVVSNCYKPRCCDPCAPRRCCDPCYDPCCKPRRRERRAPSCCNLWKQNCCDPCCKPKCCDSCGNRGGNRGGPVVY